ncbi:MAG: hypothetical protein ACYC0H_00220 [Solirubrobacteraceae bacterium]
MSGACPIRYARGNVLIGPGGDVAALFRLRMSSYSYLPVGEKWALARRLQRLAHTIAADFSLWRVNRAIPAASYIAENERLLDDRHQDRGAWHAFLAGHKARLAQLDAHAPEAYLAVSLAQGSPVGPGAGLLRSVDRARRRIEEIAGIGSESPIGAGELFALLAQEERVFERLRGLVGMRRATTAELQWLLRRAACRGVAEPTLDQHWQPDALVIQAGDGVAFQPLSYDIERCCNAAITEHERTLEIDSEEGRCYQALLALGSLADAPQFPGAAEILFAPLEAVRWPVDAVLHARWLGNRQALAAVRKRIADAEHAYREQLAGAAHGPSFTAAEDRVLAREYEQRLQAGGQEPMLFASIGLALGAASEQELEWRVAILAEQYGDVQLHRPAGLQYQLWVEHLPRPDGWL